MMVSHFSKAVARHSFAVLRLFPRLKFDWVDFSYLVDLEMFREAARYAVAGVERMVTLAHQADS
jgi:hypothetical protein